jgi:hypothetical protein
VAPVLLTHRYLGTVAYLGGLPAVLEEFCWSFAQLVQYNAEYLCRPGEFVHYDRAKVSLHDYARNTLVERIRGDWLLMVDADHAFEPDLAARLLRKLDEYQCDVVTAVYVHKHPPHTPVLYQYNGQGMEPIHDWDRRAEAFQIGSAGAGSLLVKRSVFTRIKSELKEGPFDRIAPFGEDHSFFIRLHRLGIAAFAVPSIESPHLEVRKTSLADHHPHGRARRRTTVRAFAGA